MRTMRMSFVRLGAALLLAAAGWPALAVAAPVAPPAAAAAAEADVLLASSRGDSNHRWNRGRHGERRHAERNRGGRDRYERSRHYGRHGDDRRRHAYRHHTPRHYRHSGWGYPRYVYGYPRYAYGYPRAYYGYPYYGYGLGFSSWRRGSSVSVFGSIPLSAPVPPPARTVTVGQAVATDDLVQGCVDYMAAHVQRRGGSFGSATDVRVAQEDGAIVISGGSETGIPFACRMSPDGGLLGIQVGAGY